MKENIFSIMHTYYYCRRIFNTVDELGTILIENPIWGCSLSIRGYTSLSDRVWVWEHASVRRLDARQSSFFFDLRYYFQPVFANPLLGTFHDGEQIQWPPPPYGPGGTGEIKYPWRNKLSSGQTGRHHPLRRRPV